jgi:glyoxylase-like metal-dependent hydrolase (beta-lactamase superfamily II)
MAVLFCGDLLIQGGTVVIPGSRGGNMTAYLESLQRVGRLDPRRVLPAHGQAIEQPMELIQNYLAHRREREAQILTAMTDGHSTVEALTACIYDALPASLTGAARDTVLAHLIKLETEGRAELIDGHWRRRTAAEARSFP